MQPTNNLQLKIQLPYHWSEETAKNYFYRHCPTASLELNLAGKSGLLIFKCYADMLDAMKCASIPHLNSTPTLQLYYDTKYFLVHESIFNSHHQQGSFKFSLSKKERLNECFLKYESVVFLVHNCKKIVKNGLLMSLLSNGTKHVYQCDIRLFTTDIPFEYIKKQILLRTRYDDGLFPFSDPCGLLDLVFKSRAAFLELDDDIGKFIYSLFASPKGHAILSISR